MKYLITDKENGCAFEEYNHDHNEMTCCRAKTKIKVGNRYVCVYHLSHVLLTDKAPEMKGLDGNHIPFVSDFISLAKGEKVKSQQLDMDF
jgi:hypothetical protein